MKHIIIAAGILALAASSLSAIRPKVDYQYRYLEITGVERQDSCLRLSFALKHLPGYWVSIPKDEFFLVDRNDTTRKFRILGSENFELDKRVWMKESGRHEGVILFEPVPEDVKIADLIEYDGKEKGNVALGIHLDEQDTDSMPQFISPASLFSGNPAEKWTGLDPDRYQDIQGYKEGSGAHIRGKFHNYVPEIGYSTLTLTTNNSVNGSKEVNLGNINPDGTFAFDVKLDYPQFTYLSIGKAGKNVFVNPGDTLEIVATTLSDFTNLTDGYMKYFRFAGKLNDATAVNVLADSLINHFELKNLYKTYGVAQNDSSENSVIEKNKEIALLLDKTVDALPSFLANTETSTLVKDMLATYAISKIMETAEDNQLFFRDNHRPTLKRDSTGKISFGEFETINLQAIAEPWKRHIKAIYHNPLMISTGWIIPNRWQYNDLFYPSVTAAEGSISPQLMKKLDELKEYYNLSDEELLKPTGRNIYSSFHLLKLLDADNLRLTGIGNCFAAQLARVNSFISYKCNVPVADKEELFNKRELVGNLVSLVDYPTLSNALLNAYATLASDLALAETPMKESSEFKKLDIGKNADVLKELIKPYLGNVILIDFWGLGCAPCRIGMVEQKPILERFAGKPFKVLYVAVDSEMAACNRWLDKEGIKGEHIYVSPDNWNRLSQYFGFTGIPFCVLINGKGELLKTHFYLEHPGSDKEIERHINSLSN